MLIPAIYAENFGILGFSYVSDVDVRRAPPPWELFLGILPPLVVSGMAGTILLLPVTGVIDVYCVRLSVAACQPVTAHSTVNI